MKVTIKDFDVKMELGNNGVELGVDRPRGGHLGDLILTKTNWSGAMVEPIAATGS